MESKVVVTHQIDEPAVAAAELAGALEGFALAENSIGILFCYSDCDVPELTALLQRQLPFLVVGCTTVATLDGESGFSALAAVLMVLTAEDCVFSTALSEPIFPDNAPEQIEAAWQEIALSLETPPKLVFALPPYQLDIPLDVYPETLNALAPGVPVVGGLPTYNANGDQNLVLYQGSAYGNRMVLVAISGNIHPVTCVQTVTSNPIERKRLVTKSERNIIYRVGDKTFIEYLEDFGMPVSGLASGNNTVVFVSNPLLLEHAPSSSGGIEDIGFLRILHEVNLEAGSGTAIGCIPQGSTISICPLDRKEVTQAAVLGAENLTRKMANVPDYQFSTVLAVSCIGRSLLMSPNNGVEAEKLRQGLPEGLALGGFYSYGEIGPLLGLEESSSSDNFAHNESLMLCAF